MAQPPVQFVISTSTISTSDFDSSQNCTSTNYSRIVWEGHAIFCFSRFNKITTCKRMMKFFNLHDSIVIKIMQELGQLTSWFCVTLKIISPVFFMLNMTKFVNNSLLGNSSEIKMAVDFRSNFVH